ncbi:hypothetical protein BRADI_4g31813v3 [Brachypodium distachyon]|uniref:Uncharacterized protein n=1 Tax=Brachypodium distachyon TaxID=15368 RepID=A0A2K2CRQ4_BRADI|nr:hypothetical protein BRADI_4g31813v3 [Brachypodium distachyon]
MILWRFYNLYFPDSLICGHPITEIKIMTHSARPLSISRRSTAISPATRRITSSRKESSHT